MAWYLQKPSSLDANQTLYYCGERRWSQNFDEKIKFTTKTKSSEEASNQRYKNVTSVKI